MARLLMIEDDQDLAEMVGIYLGRAGMTWNTARAPATDSLPRTRVGSMRSSWT